MSKKNLIDELYHSLPDDDIDLLTDCLNSCRRYSYQDTFADRYKETLELVEDEGGNLIDLNDLLYEINVMYGKNFDFGPMGRITDVKEKQNATN